MEHDVVIILKGYFGGTTKSDDDVVNEPTLKRPTSARTVFPMESTSLEFTIMGLTKESIRAVKDAIDKCCAQESSDMLIDGKEYSSILKALNKQQACLLSKII